MLGHDLETVRISAFCGTYLQITFGYKGMLFFFNNHQDKIENVHSYLTQLKKSSSISSF
jgi:hypothetical protein